VEPDQFIHKDEWLFTFFLKGRKSRTPTRAMMRAESDNPEARAMMRAKSDNPEAGAMMCADEIPREVAVRP